jgi:hypothetical protein
VCWHTGCFFFAQEIPAMDTRRIQSEHVRKRLAQVAWEAVFLATLLAPWAAILAWLFRRNTLE